MLGIEAASVERWDPRILISAAVTRDERIERFLQRARAGYDAQPILFHPPQPMLVGGRHFAVVTETGGLHRGSVHTLPNFRFRDAFEPVARILSDSGTPVLVAAGAGHGNYYHAVFETAATVLLHRGLSRDPMIPLLLPQRSELWMRHLLATLAIDNPQVTVASDEAILLDAGLLASQIDAGISAAPHPAALAALRDRAAGHARDRGRRVYVSRQDAGTRRRMDNEQMLCEALGTAGFEIVTAGSLPVAAQIALFCEAELIVAPHGAALANLAFVDDGVDGPAVIELFQENYLNRCFLAIAQAKRLRYRAIVNPSGAAAGHHHDTSWRADIRCCSRRSADR
ncbi:glycosyltransferase family 61 protein [Sphingomonas sp.]|uniref:glycosyltransferase family 61 protein n=1 Tax=Sphingomonas sp. TaxID=28214 RepID=UPI003B00936C